MAEDGAVLFLASRHRLPGQSEILGSAADVLTEFTDLG
jgi:hypothetical protein